MYQKNSLEELYECLKRFHLSDSLYVIGAINAALKYGTVTATQTDIPKWIIEWLRVRGQTEHDRRSININMTRMARFLLLSSANDHKGMFLDLNGKEFYKAYNLVRDLHDKEIEGEDFAKHLMTYFGRLGQWQFPLQASRKQIIGRGYLLFIDLMETVVTDYDFDAKFRQYFGMSLVEFMMTGYAMWLLCNGTLDYEMNVEIAALQSIVTLENQRRFLNLSSGTAKDYRIAARGKNWQRMDKMKDIYGLDPFVKIPAIAVERSGKLRSDSYVVPQPKYFLDRASSGIFYLLADKEMQIAHPKGNPFRIAFGQIYRTYVGKHLEQEKLLAFIDLDDDFPFKWDKLIPDFAVIDGECCLLIEVKTTLLNADSRTFQEPQALRNEANGGSLAKATKQLHTFRKAILAGELKDPRFSGVRRVINFIIGYEDVFSLNTSLLPLLDEFHGDATVDLQLGCISDVDALGAAIANGENIVKTMREKVDDEAKRVWSVATLWNGMEDRDNPVINHAFETFNSRLLKGLKPGRNQGN